MNLSPTDIQRIEKQFDHFCKKVIANEGKDILNHFNYVFKNEKPINSLSTKESNELFVTDNYDFFFGKITVLDFVVEIQNDLLYEALHSLKEHRRDVVLLSFWIGMPDAEIAQIIKLPRSTVNHMKTSSLKQLKKYLEGKNIG